MAALVQSYPQQSHTVTMLQTRPSSASGIQPTSQTDSRQFSTGALQRNSFHGINGMQLLNHRGHNSLSTMPAYAFTNTSAMHAGQWTMHPLQSSQRTTSAPVVTSTQHNESPRNTRYPAPLSVSRASSSSPDLSPLSHRSGAKDDSVLAGTGTACIATRAPRSQARFITSNSIPSLAPALTIQAKASPDRYRRPGSRRNESTSSQQNPSPVSTASIPNVVNFYGSASQPAKSQHMDLNIPQFTGHESHLTAPVDDSQIRRAVPRDQAAKRYRRRSVHTMDANDDAPWQTDVSQPRSRQLSSADGRIDQQSHIIDQQHPLRSSPIVSIRPVTPHGRHHSTNSVGSTQSCSHSRSSSPKQEASASKSAISSPRMPSVSPVNTAEQASLKSDAPKLVDIPPRGSSDIVKKFNTPSPLSKPMTINTETLSPKDSFASAINAALQAPAKPTYAQVITGVNASSPAAQQLAALNEKESKKTKTSRLRRAFSFGSAAELRKASAENNAANNAATGNAAGSADRARLRKEKHQEEQEAEHARIAEQQEAAGLGAGIYSGQGNFFTGSTDNLSISSTASSASVMIRKMGKGMKKSTRSLVGLFRPKSVLGVPAADVSFPEASEAQVSMVTVEAEREKVNVNARANELAAGGTGYPRLERNSIDATAATVCLVGERLGSSSTENSAPRQSIIGGEKERAEVLAAVKKGILKRTCTDSTTPSPVIKPSDARSPSFNLPQISHVSCSSTLSTPSTPNNDTHGHRRTGSVTLGGEDYFMSALRFRGESKSLPATPQDGVSKRNATFSPRIQFHDTWPSGEYDRRGEIATCNRLTPMLAQQIKEELNTFKMEMEVHENSKIYTHFF